MSAFLYLEHLSDRDLAFIAAAAGGRDDRSRLRADPDRLQTLLQQPALFDALFRRSDGSAFLHASPFVVFAVLVHRATMDLTGVRFVDEWAGPRQRVPVFDVEAIRDFAGDPGHQFFLAELLASYTRVSSGTVWVQTARGWRRRRFSELDPVQLVEMLELVSDRERPAVYRRLGDLALFLSGVFPDYAGDRLLPPREQQRLRRGLSRTGAAFDGTGDGVWVLEQIGSRCYRVSGQAAQSAGGGSRRVLLEMADGFGRARRILTFLTDRYLFTRRDQWFPIGG